MHRTNIYLTEDQVKRLDAEAAATGSSRSDLVRDAIEERFPPKPALDPEVVAAFVELGERWDELVGDMFQDDPDLRIER